MSVELIPNCNHCAHMGVSNGTFFTMVNDSGMATVIGNQKANDPVNASNEDALECAKILKAWTPPDGWGYSLTSEAMKELFLDFFKHCDGFHTI